MRPAWVVLFLGLAVIAGTCTARANEEIFVSIPDQELALVRGTDTTRFPVSTSKFGVGDVTGTYRTPLGTLFVSGKFGDSLPSGAVIKSRIATGEMVNVNAPGRDAIVSRVIWLRGKESVNRNAHDRCIYIHGTPEERRIGRVSSFGCIRMRSKDVITLYPLVHIGTHVTISMKHLDDLVPKPGPELVARSD